MSYEAEALRGRRAQEVLDNEIYVETYALLEAELVRQWRDCRNKDDREQIHQLLITLDKVKIAMESVMRSGEIASAKLIEKESKLSRAVRTVWSSKAA